MSLRRLGVERIDLVQLHRIDPQVPLEEQVGLLGELIEEGKVAAVGLSEVTVDEIEAARRVAPVVMVQNRVNLVEPGGSRCWTTAGPKASGSSPGSPSSCPSPAPRRWRTSRRVEESCRAALVEPSDEQVDILDAAGRGEGSRA